MRQAIRLDAQRGDSVDRRQSLSLWLALDDGGPPGNRGAASIKHVSDFCCGISDLPHRTAVTPH